MGANGSLAFWIQECINFITGNLDKKNTQLVHQLIDELNKELNMTVIIVTHNVELAKMMEKEVTIEDGKIIPVTNYN